MTTTDRILLADRIPTMTTDPTGTAAIAMTDGVSSGFRPIGEPDTAPMPAVATSVNPRRPGTTNRRCVVHSTLPQRRGRVGTRGTAELPAGSAHPQGPCPRLRDGFCKMALRARVQPGEHLRRESSVSGNRC